MTQINEIGTVRIVSAIVDKEKAVFYKEDGNTIVVKQGDPRLQKIIEQVIPITQKGGVAVVSFQTFSVFEEFEKKSGGFLKMFKVAKNKIAQIFVAPEEQVLELPPEPEQVTNPAVNTPTQGAYAPYMEPVEENLPPAVKVAQAVSSTNINRREQIKNYVQPIVNDADIMDDETIVAVIGDTVIPNMEKLKPYINHALKTGSIEGIHKFLERVSKVIANRGHSIEDLFRFLERGDLPIADDGSIIAYKMLNLRADSTSKDTFVDCHTGRVPQRVGSYVKVDESLVDRNRSNECSNGLHIARRGYLSGFSGNVCVLIKLAPEDVVTVPHRDANKIRVMGYHILGVIPDEAVTLLKRNSPMDSVPEAKKMLANAIKGNHIGIIERVEIHGQSGGNLKIIPLDTIIGKEGHIILTDEITKQDAAKGTAIDSSPKVTEKLTAPTITPKSINKKVNKIIEKGIAEVLDSEIKKSMDQNSETSAQRAARRKREKRAALKALGHHTSEVPTAKKVAKPSKITINETKNRKEITIVKKPTKTKKPEPKNERKSVLKAPAMNATDKEWAMYFYLDGQWAALKALQKSKKIGMHKLGFNAAQLIIIKDHM